MCASRYLTPDPDETGTRKCLDETRSLEKFRLKPFGFEGQDQLVTDWQQIREMIYGDHEKPA